MNYPHFHTPFPWHPSKYCRAIVTADGFWNDASICFTLWYSVRLHFWNHYYIHTLESAVIPLLPLIASGFEGHSFPFVFPSCPRSQAPISNSNIPNLLNPSSSVIHCSCWIVLVKSSQHGLRTKRVLHYCIALLLPWKQASFRAVT
jgi:hypothetical protein